MDFISSFFGRGGYLPHGVCLSWSPAMLGTMVVSGLLIAASYFSIPLALAYYTRRRNLGPYRWVAVLFGLFIAACGVTHVLDVWTLWVPDYGVQVVGKAITALLSLATATLLWPLMPRLLAIPSVGQLQQAVQSLAVEVGRRRSAEQHVQELEQALAVTLASIDAAFVATDRQGRVTQMNAVAERLTGWPLAVARGLDVWQVVARQDIPGDRTAANPVDVVARSAGGVEHTHHVSVLTRGGQAYAADLNVAVTRDDTGALRGLAVVFRDTTRSRAAEAELRRLAAMVASSNDAIVTKSLDGRILSWNAAAVQLFGYSVDEALQMPVQRLIPPDREAEEMRILADLAHGRTVPTFDTERLTKDGRRVEVSITISPVRDADGRIVGGSKIARDITARRRMDAALREGELARVRAEQLQAENLRIVEANRLKSQFLANMSHELRTPLNAVIGFAELMHSGTVPADSPKHHEYLGHIASSGRHLLQLINDVLDLSKVEAGKFDFHPEPVMLPLVVAEVTGVLHGALMRKHLQLQLEMPEDLGVLMLDAARLKQVLYNYLSNAIKFTPEQGRITVRARAEGPACFRLEVEDTGIGIAAHDLPRLFVEFQQLDAGYDKRHQGTGLGLALTRRLVQAQGGQVGVRSTPGQGSVFHFVLPRRPATGPCEPEADAPRVLVVEPAGDGQARLVQALAAAGFRADEAPTAEQALHRAAQRGYDAITLNLQLPDQPGLQALAHIRSGGPSRESPVVGVHMPVVPGAVASFGIANVLFKPLRSHEVAQALAGYAQTPAGPGCVMVIDDDPLALQLMADTLAGLGLGTQTFVDGRAALAELERCLAAVPPHTVPLPLPDAIVLDLMMPGFDGFAVLDALQSRPAWAAVPVYIWTSMLLTDAEYAQLAQSAQAIVSKGGGAVDAVLASLRRGQQVPA